MGRQDPEGPGVEARGIIDDSTATPDVLDVPDEEILEAAGLTAEEARRLVRDAEAKAARQNGAADGRTKQHSGR